MEENSKINSLRAGFEPARAMPIGFQVQRLNHSAITAVANSRRQLGIYSKAHFITLKKYKSSYFKVLYLESNSIFNDMCIQCTF